MFLSFSMLLLFSMLLSFSWWALAPGGRLVRSDLDVILGSVQTDDDAEAGSHTRPLFSST